VPYHNEMFCTSGNQLQSVKVPGISKDSLLNGMSAFNGVFYYVGGNHYQY